MNQKGKVLVVDDSEDVRTMLVRILGSSYHTVQAENGKEALEKCESEDFDVIILDENMPVMGGHECFSILRERSNFTPVIFCTGGANPVHQKRELNAGAFDYIGKPFDIDSLLHLVNQGFMTKQRLLSKRANSR